MAYIDMLRNLKAKYVSVRPQVAGSKAEISKLKLDMDKIIEVEKKAYLIDDMTADQNHVQEQKTGITNAETAAANVLAAIDARMAELDDLIAAEEARIAAEEARRRAEAEAAAKN